MNVVNAPFFKFHSRRFIAVVKDIPLLYMALLLVMLAGGGTALFVFMETAKGAWLTGDGMVFILLLFHLRRDDYHFVHLVAERPRQVFAAGYALLSLPVVLLEVARGFFPVAAAVMAGCAAVGCIKQPRRRSKSFPVPRLVPVEVFEIRTGFRRHGLVLLMFYLGAYAALLLPYLSFVLLWFCLCFMLESFNCCEPAALLRSRELAPRRFLQRKISANLRFSALLIAPVCIACTYAKAEFPMLKAELQTLVEQRSTHLISELLAGHGEN
ncbi:hypothetical protein FACS189438_1310 [Bacteroidia bacterium]|nr:hypothetical protein FACS189438_1310 [Bacteroidia bacterium]